MPKTFETKKRVVAITKAEKTCRLGKDLPLLCFDIIGSVSFTSYGRGAFIWFR